MHNENWQQKFEDKTGTIFGQKRKVILYDLMTLGKNDKAFYNQIACLINWDTSEAIDGYTIDELKDMKDTLEHAIQTMQRKDCVGQLYLY